MEEEESYKRKGRKRRMCDSKDRKEGGMRKGITLVERKEEEEGEEEGGRGSRGGGGGGTRCNSPRKNQ